MSGIDIPVDGALVDYGDIMGLNHETELKRKGMRELKEEIQRIEDMSMVELKNECSKSMETPSRCKKDTLDS